MSRRRPNKKGPQNLFDFPYYQHVGIDYICQSCSLAGRRRQLARVCSRLANDIEPWLDGALSPGVREELLPPKLRLICDDCGAKPEVRFDRIEQHLANLALRHAERPFYEDIRV